MTTDAAGAAQGKEITKPGTPLTWAISIAACIYLLWTCAMLFYSTGVFANLFASMGVDPPLPTRIVIGTYRFTYPVLFGGAAVLVIAKQFYIREKWINISTTLGTVWVLDIIGNEIVRVLYRPLLDIMEKLSK